MPPVQSPTSGKMPAPPEVKIQKFVEKGKSCAYYLGCVVFGFLLDYKWTIFSRRFRKLNIGLGIYQIYKNIVICFTLTSSLLILIFYFDSNIISAIYTKSGCTN